MYQITPTRRSRIRKYSFLIVIFLLLIACLASALILAHHYQNITTSARFRALLQLQEYSAVLPDAMKKASMVSDTAVFTEQLIITAENAACAKLCLEDLPGDTAQYQNIQKFYTQSKDYALTLQKKTAGGTVIQDAERNMLLQLSNYAQQLNESLDDIVTQVLQQKIGLQDAAFLLSGQEIPAYVSGALEQLPETFADFPTLLYDGPFADIDMKTQYAWLRKQPEYPQKDAGADAAQLLQIAEVLLRSEGEMNVPFPCYQFFYQDATIQISKNGGYLLRLIRDVQAGEIQYKKEDAVEAAQQFLAENNYKNMKDSYYEIVNGICTIQFVRQDGEVLCYAEQIKVRVLLDTLEIAGFDASLYLQNHQPKRTLDVPQYTADEISAMLPFSTVTLRGMAYIPKNQQEILCYEFYCTDSAGTFLLYYNVQSGKEEEVFLVILSENAMLTR